MWNWLSFSSVSVSYSISYSFQRALHTLKWVLFLQVIFEILTFYFGFHTFHVYSHRHMYIHSVMCTSACKYMYINIPPFTCCFLLQLFSTALLPCRQVNGPNSPASSCFSTTGVFRGVWWEQKDADLRDFNMEVPAGNTIASLLWLRQASRGRAQGYSLSPWMLPEWALILSLWDNPTSPGWLEESAKNNWMPYNAKVLQTNTK